MNLKLSLCLALAPVALWTATPVRGVEPGYVDFGKLMRPHKGEFVEVTLGKGILKIASCVVRCGDSGAADVISGLSRVRVNVVGLDDSNRAATVEKLASVRERLAREGWEQIVTARGKKHEDVVIHLKQSEGEVIEGLFVTVIDEHKKEAVFVNVVGNIKPEHLAVLGENLQIKQLKLGAKAKKSEKI